MGAKTIRMSEDIALRSSCAADVPYIVETWVKAYRHSDRARDAGSAYLRGQQALIRSILYRAAVVVACLDSDPDAIVGFAVTERNTVHYVHVRRPFRKSGIAKTLLGNLYSTPGVVYTHKQLLLDDGKKTRLPIPPGWVYDPYATNQEKK